MQNFFTNEDFPCSEVEFENRFSTEQACRDYLINMKWPDGFHCRNCGHKEYWISAKYLYICTRCETPHSLTAGTVMHATKKTIDLLVQSHVVVHNPQVRCQCCQP